MVLNANELSRARIWATSIALALTLAATACIKATPIQRLAKKTSMAVAFVNNERGTLVNVPPAFSERIARSLNERNLAMNALAVDGYRDELQRKRATQDRLQAVSQRMGREKLLLMVETRASYYSQLEGRFRWTVHVKLSLAQKGDEDSARIASFSVPVMMNFDHQRERDALMYAAGPLTRKLGQELDVFLTGLDLPVSENHLDTDNAGSPDGTTDSRHLAPMYFVMLDRFHNGDLSNDDTVNRSDPQAFHGGDIAGLIDKLDYIQDMGFGTIWLSPIFAMRTEKLDGQGAFHGYWTEDLTRPEPRFGNVSDLRKLREQLEARDMQLIIDIVLNHVGYDTRLVTEKPHWFHSKGDIKNWDDPVQVTTHDVHGLPDLNQQNPEVYDYLLSASAHWIKTLRPAGFRLDAVKHIDNAFWRSYTRDLTRHTKERLHTVGELFNGNPADIVAGFERGGFTYLFDFPLYYAMNDVFCKGQDMRRLVSILSLDRMYPDRSRLVTFADNHDLPRVFSACGQDAERVQALLTFMLTARGVPCLNYGTEIAMRGEREPANRADMVFSRSSPLREQITRLLALRKRHAVLASGDDVPLTVTSSRYAYLRVNGREVALIAINLGKDAWTISHPLKDVNSGVDALTGEPVPGEQFQIRPGRVRIVLFTPSDPAAYQQRLTALGRDATTTIEIIVKSNADDMRLVGAGPELGNWNLAQASRATRLPDGRFRFEVDFPSHATVAFKLVRTVAGNDRWDQGENRYLVVARHVDKPLEIDDVANN